MPLPLNSRYQNLPAFEAKDADGVVHPTIAMRLAVAQTGDLHAFRHVVVAGETMEALAWRYYSSSESWWRIADANPHAFPYDLESGTSVIIPSGSEVGRVVRSRRF
jgi:nucleoid-associated protein YgaU